MVQFIYMYGDIIQFVVYVVNALAVGAAALLAACYWVKFVNRTTACCEDGHGKGHHHGHHAGHHGHGDKCCETPASTEPSSSDVDVTKFVD